MSDNADYITISDNFPSKDPSQIMASFKGCELMSEDDSFNKDELGISSEESSTFVDGCISTDGTNEAVSFYEKPVWYRESSVYFFAELEKLKPWFGNATDLYETIRGIFTVALDTGENTSFCLVSAKTTCDVSTDTKDLFEKASESAASGNKDESEGRQLEVRSQLVDTTGPSESELLAQPNGLYPTPNEKLILSESPLLQGEPVRVAAPTRWLRRRDTKKISPRKKLSLSQKLEKEFDAEFEIEFEDTGSDSGDPNRVKCLTCHKLVASQYLERHVKLVHFGNKERNVPCDVCHKTYRSDKVMKQHKILVHGPKIKCALCGFNVAAGAPYDWHMKRHQQSPNIRCEYCNKNFVNEGSLKLHFRRKHTPEERVVCEVCGNSIFKEDMKIHMKNLHSPGDFICSHDSCSKNFLNQQLLDEHTKKHEKTNLCQSCGKGFVTTAELRRHEAVHLGSRAFQCAQCEKAFYTRGQLNFHERKHTNERRYKCPYCPKAYFQRPTLESHVNTHEGKRPHVCKICEANFAYKGALYTHVKLKHAM